MAKMIKFDLPIDGVKVATLDQLGDHFTTEIIAHFRSGLLARWLRSRGWTRELTAVEALASDDDAATLKELCRIFEVESDDGTIAAAIAGATGISGKHLRRSVVPSPDMLLRDLIPLFLDLGNKLEEEKEDSDLDREKILVFSVAVTAGIAAGLAREEVHDDNLKMLFSSLQSMSGEEELEVEDVPLIFKFISKCIAAGIEQTISQR